MGPESPIPLNYGTYLKSLGASYYDLVIKGYCALWGASTGPFRVLEGFGTVWSRALGLGFRHVAFFGSYAQGLGLRAYVLFCGMFTSE